MLTNYINNKPQLTSILAAAGVTVNWISVLTNTNVVIGTVGGIVGLIILWYKLKQSFYDSRTSEYKNKIEKDKMNHRNNKSYYELPNR